nr:hypothetical protein [Virgibacillus salexigens]
MKKGYPDDKAEVDVNGQKIIPRKVLAEMIKKNSKQQNQNQKHESILEGGRESFIHKKETYKTVLGSLKLKNYSFIWYQFF